MPLIDPNKMIENRVEAIRAYHKKIGIDRAELDVSGGLDSAVMLMLLAKALGPESVTAVYSNIHSSIESRRRAQDVAMVAKVNLIELDLSEAYDSMIRNFQESLRDARFPDLEIQKRMDEDPTILGSFRSCIRAPVGRVLNRMTGGGIRHGTGNEDEDRWLRFYQKGGDGEVDTNPLAMLSKGEVYQLAVKLGVPREIIEAMPTPDLWGTGDKHNDEEELSKLSGVDWSYSRVDPETGEYTKVGTIERMSRLLDVEVFDDEGSWGGKVDNFLWGTGLTEETFSIMKPTVEKFGLTLDHVDSARKWERMTRHKENPNIPTLGTRREMIEDGILTDELP